MLTQGYADRALEFLDEADRHFADGEQVRASEKLWEAAAHAVMAAAVERGWPAGSQLELKRAAERLAAEHGDVKIADRFSVAEKYYFDIEHLFMEADEWLTDRPKVRDLVARVLALLGGDAGAAG